MFVSAIVGGGGFEEAAVFSVGSTMGGCDSLSLLLSFSFFSGEDASDFGDLVLTVGNRLRVLGLTGAGRLVLALTFFLALTLLEVDLSDGCCGGGPGGRLGGADLARRGALLIFAVAVVAVGSTEKLLLLLLLTAFVGELG